MLIHNIDKIWRLHWGQGSFSFGKFSFNRHRGKIKFGMKVIVMQSSHLLIDSKSNILVLLL